MTYRFFLRHQCTMVRHGVNKNNCRPWTFFETVLRHRQTQCRRLSNMERGDTVIVVEYGGRKVTRRVIADRGEVIDICNEEEYKLAAEKKREPQGIGFRRDAVKP